MSLSFYRMDLVFFLYSEHQSEPDSGHILWLFNLWMILILEEIVHSD